MFKILKYIIVILFIYLIIFSYNLSQAKQSSVASIKITFEDGSAATLH